MPRFVTPLQFQDNDGFPFTLLEDLVYETRRHRIIRVPKGFKTDLASIPRVLWNVLPPVGRYNKAAVVHDFLYQNNGCTRAEADAVLNEAMRVLGVRVTQRWAIYAGVRLGGWVVWRRYRHGR